MFKFNANVFKSNCNSLSKHFNHTRSSCVVYHDLCQESLHKATNCDTKTKLDDHVARTHRCAEVQVASSFPTTSSPMHHNQHHHHHQPHTSGQHHHGLVYSKRVRSILLLNALLNGAQHTPQYQQTAALHKKSGKSKHQPKNELSDEELNQVIDYEMFKLELNATVEQFKQDLILNINVRMGKDIDELEVEVDGQQFLIKEIAQIGRKNANLITLNLVSYPDAIKPVLKAISDSGMNINPQQEGTMIYLPLPKMTREHRENLVKGATKLFNKVKSDVRTIQNDEIKTAKNKKAAKISEDLIFAVIDNIKASCDETVGQCEKMLEDKIKNLMS